MTRVNLSVVVPGHNEAETIPQLAPRLTAVLDSLDESWELIFVDDGSTDDTWGEVKALARRDDRVRGLRLSRCFGHQAALSAGISVAAGEAVITLDADLQHPPEVIPDLVEKGREGFDVVYAIRSPDDTEGWFKVRSARLFYNLLNRLTQLDLPEGGADFRYMTRPVALALQQMPERHRFLRGMTRWLGFTQAFIRYGREPRAAGSSKYSLTAMVRFAFDAIVSFSALPLKIASVLGFAFGVIGSIYLLFVVVIRLLGAEVVPGWTSVVGAVLVLGGVQLACLGIIGQYLGRMYEEIKGRPLYIVWEDTRSLDHAEGADQPAGLTGGLVRR
jgi:polyisoprenyl-phosphate glycosyltransferase